MKLLRYIALALSLFVGYMCITPSHYLAWAKVGLVPDDYRFGDLYRLANLPQFKELQTKCPPLTPPLSYKDRQHASTALYVIGDSFFEPERVDSLDFQVKHYQYVHKNQVANIQLDTTLTNILLIESVERHTREYLKKVIDNYRVGLPVNESKPIEHRSFLQKLKDYDQQIQTAFRFDHMDQRIENVAFNFDFFLKIKEWKATLNYHLLGKTTGNVAVSKNGQHLFYGLDTDIAKKENTSFSQLPESEVDSMVKYLNLSAKKYQALGFKKVYFSIIPNKASLLEPTRGQYNHLITRLQENKNLHVPFVDAYHLFSKNPTKVYALSDSHWNCEGRRLYLQELGKIIN